MAKSSDPRIKDLETIKGVFDKHNVRFFLTYGAVLGHVRDGDFIPHDEDIDIAVVDPVDFKTRKSIGWMLYDLGFEPQPIAFNVFGRMEPAEMGYNGDGKTGIIVCERGFKFTIFFFYPEECKQHGMEYVCVPRQSAMKLIATPVRFFEKADKIKINRLEYNVPSPVEAYLDFTYFNNWKDKTDRRHGETYYEMHAIESITQEQGTNAMYI